MLELEEGWRQSTGGAVALSLLKQIPEKKRQDQFSRHLIRASLDLAIATFFGKNDPSVTVDESLPGTWRVRDMRFLFLSAVDDHALTKIEEALPCTCVIVPADHDLLLRQALNSMFPRDCPGVMTFGDFISWRATFACLDANWSRDRAMHHLFCSYNFYAEASGLDPAIWIHIPQRLTRYPLPILATVKSRDTKPEMIVRRLLHRLGYRFRLHRRDLPDTPDIVLPRLRKIINVHGCFWHMHACQSRRRPRVTAASYWIANSAANFRRDRRTRAALHRAGWQVLVVWECQTKKCERLAETLRHFLESTK